METLTTQTAIPHAPEGLTLSAEEDGTLQLGEGAVRVGGRSYDVDARTVEPKRLKTKLAQTDVWLVWRSDEVAYVVGKGSVDTPIEAPCETAEGDCRVLARVARVKVWPEDTGREDRTVVWLIRPTPMTETRHEPVRDPETGEQVFEVWKKVSEVSRAEATDYADHEDTRVEPKTTQETVTVTR